MGYTDSGPASGCVEIDNNNTVDTGALTNPYFNGNLSVNGIAVGTYLASPANQSASTGVYNEGNQLKGEIENEGANFGPQILPFGSLPVTNYSQADLATACSTYCTAATVVGPDGPGGAMPAVGITNGTGGLNVVVATDNRATYAGDHYLYWSWVAPFPGQPFTLGGGNVGDENTFNLFTAGTDTFAPTNCGTVSCSSSYAYPQAFGTILAYNGWHPEVAIATIVAGDSTPHNVSFYLTTGGLGGQFGEPGWTFIPGPNNPACTAAGTCTLTATDIESARQDHYHGCVPPNQSAGAVVTCEAISSGTEVKVNGGSALTTSNQTGVLPYLCADTSGSGTPKLHDPKLYAHGNCIAYTTTTLWVESR